MTPLPPLPLSSAPPTSGNSATPAATSGGTTTSSSGSRRKKKASKIRGDATNSSNNKNSSSRRKITTILHVLLGASLVLVLLHTVSLLIQGHALLEEQTNAFATAHKEDFMNLQKGVEGGFSTGYRGGSDTQQQQQEQEPVRKFTTMSDAKSTTSTNTNTIANALQNLRILVAIASYDFKQIPHLEETLDGYHQICAAGAAQVHVVVHTTVVYPVVWLDLWQTRFRCPRFTLTLSVENKSLRLHLVDLHRHLFYEELNNYDLFIYTEDDIRVTPTTVATYWYETQQLKQILGQEGNDQNTNNNDYTMYNVGIVRYEYNFPSVVIDDKTRHATENVTRVYWEHSRAVAQGEAIVPGAASQVESLSQQQQQQRRYIHMKNHHQGMFLATRPHLERWKALPNCQFDIPTERPSYPGKPHQPLFGTQRVWMSSVQLMEPKYCNVQQVIPMDHFGALTVHHIPNKNYRRIKGGMSKLNHGNGTELAELEQGSPMLITALQLHIAMRQAWPVTPQIPYKGNIRMLDHVTEDRTPVLEERLRAFQQYLARGGVLSDQDMQRTDLIEWEERSAQLQKLEDQRRRQAYAKRRKERQQQQ